MRRNTLLLALLIGTYMPVVSAQFEEAFAACSMESDPELRLDCYDELAELGPQEPGSPSVVVTDAVVKSNSLAANGITPGHEAQPYVPRGLSSDGPNYFGISNAQKFSGRGDRGEQNHVEFNLSVKYPLFINDSSVNNGSNQGISIRWPERAYFIYNGAYDFHALNSLNNIPRLNEQKLDWYRSAPVISRDQNPGLALEWDLTRDGSSRFRFAVMHHSNGQQKSFNDNPDPGEVAAAELEKQRLIGEINGLIAGPEGEDYALQDLSRSSNYVSLRYQHILSGRVDGEAGWKQYQLELRPYYFGLDDDVFWEDGPSARSKLTDYDGIRFLWEHYDQNSIFNFGGKIFGQDSFAFIKRLELKSGTLGVKNLRQVSSKLSLGWKLDKLVLMAYYFNGYGKELSSYHYRSQHWGLGFEFR